MTSKQQDYYLALSGRDLTKDMGRPSQVIADAIDARRDTTQEQKALYLRITGHELKAQAAGVAATILWKLLRTIRRMDAKMNG